jgi:hypothetical protein
MVLQRVQGEYAKRSQWAVENENDMTLDLMIISVGASSKLDARHD